VALNLRFPPVGSAPAVGRRVFGLQALFEAAEQNAVPLVLLVLPGVELLLDLEAPVHHEGRAQHREPVAGHVELAGLRGREGDVRVKERRWDQWKQDEAGGDGPQRVKLISNEVDGQLKGQYADSVSYTFKLGDSEFKTEVILTESLVRVKLAHLILCFP